MDQYIAALRKYATFSGRARRKEYWMFVLFNCIFAIAFAVIDRFLGTREVFGNIYGLAVLVPGIAAGVRRMHDTNHSGWWLLLPIANLIFAVTEGDLMENQFGPDPKGVTE